MKKIWEQFALLGKAAKQDLMAILVLKALVLSRSLLLLGRFTYNPDTSLSIFVMRKEIQVWE